MFEPISTEAIVSWVDDLRLGDIDDRELARLPGPDCEIVLWQFAPRFSSGFAALGYQSASS